MFMFLIVILYSLFFSVICLSRNFSIQHFEDDISSSVSIFPSSLHPSLSFYPLSFLDFLHFSVLLLFLYSEKSNVSNFALEAALLSLHLPIACVCMLFKLRYVWLYIESIWIHRLNKDHFGASILVKYILFVELNLQSS